MTGTSSVGSILVSTVVLLSLMTGCTAIQLRMLFRRGTGFMTNGPVFLFITIVSLALSLWTFLPLVLVVFAYQSYIFYISLVDEARPQWVTNQICHWNSDTAAALDEDDRLYPGGLSEWWHS